LMATSGKKHWPPMGRTQWPLTLVTTEKEMALAEAGEMRATLRRIRSSRTFRAGRALSEAQSVSGASRALPRLLAIIREEKKKRDV
ncbi:hypothetical protein, partial [Micrococcus luteus]|uniref:hypothetical protein n=1 Tax=Micrococcus luteus TaxID=1270 RepID=UPI001C92DE46